MSDKIKDGGPAFPVNPVSTSQEKDITITSYPWGGMSPRDYFAAKAMQGFLSGFRTPAGIYSEDSTSAINISRLSYDIADAMLEAREK